jgi:hypothetical protein
MKRRDFLKRTAIGGAALAVVPMSLVSGKPKPIITSFSTKMPRDKPIYPEIKEFWEHGIVSHNGFNVPDGIRSKYHLLSYVPNKHDQAGYSICRRTYIIGDHETNNVTNEHIKIREMKYMIEDCERVLKNPQNYVYIKEL